MSIRPDNLTLDKLLQGKLFRIPEYQRSYSWTTKQRKDLFGDIKKIAQSQDSERHHFMSTVVCLQTREKEEVGADEFGVFHIVDGQQRLTTLIILLKAIAKKLSVGDDTEQREATKLSELLVKENGRLILLQTNHDNMQLFRNYLSKGEIPNEEDSQTLADRNIIQSFNECCQFVDQWESGALQLFKTIKNRLDFIFYVLDDEGTVHTIFEVLNSRGLEVDWLDKCKSMLMGIAFEKLDDPAKEECIAELQSYWSKIYQSIGIKKIQGQEILRFAATLTDSDGGSKLSSAESAMDFFRQECEKNPKNVVDVSNKFLTIAKQLEKIISNPRLKAVADISHARLLGVSIMLNKKLSKNESSNILREWEKVTFKIFGIYRRDARTKVGEYVRLAREIFLQASDPDDNRSGSELLQKVADLGTDYPIEKAAEQLKETNCYAGWESELIYFLFRYEEHLSKECGGSISMEEWEKVWNASPSRTIEHIHPQIPSDEWHGKFGTKKDYIARQTQRLGNLILLPPGVNSTASNKGFVEKKVLYEKHRHLKLIDEILSLEDWYIETMVKREEKLIQWAIKEWK